MKKLAILLCVWGAVAAAHAAPSQTELKRLEQRIQQEKQAQQENQRKAGELSSEVRAVRQQIIQLAQTVQAREEQLSALEKKQRELQRRQAVLEENLALTDQQLVRLLAGMQTLALHPPAALWIRPSAPVEKLRSHLLMRQSLPVVGSLSAQTRADLAELTQVKAELAAQISRTKEVAAQLAERTEQMDRLLQQKSLLQAQYAISQENARKRVQELAAQAGDLKDLLKKLEQEKRRQAALRQQEQMQASQQAVRQAGQLRGVVRPLPLAAPAPSGGSFARSFGKLRYPARGEIVQRFGETSVSGAHTKGVSVATRPQAQVTAPADAVVLFAGPFKDYGQLLILDHGDNYLTLLAGMEIINATVGQELLAGEPIGVMKQMNPRLYLEIRQDGQPIDPAPWFS